MKDGEARWISRPAQKYRATTYRPPHPASKAVHAPRFDVKTDAKRDELLTEFGKDTLRDRYLLPGESYQDLFARVAAAYADDAEHAQRVYDYISKLWFMPATPVLSNGGTGRGLPISCYLNSVDDSLEGIVGTWNENVWLASPRRRHRHLLGPRSRHRRAGRPQRQDQRDHPVRPRDGQPDAGDQPGLAAPRFGRLLPRRLAPRDRGVPRDPQTVGRLQPQGAQPAPRRARSPTSSWKRCATAREFILRSPKDGSERGKVDARSLFQKLVETRLATGEPYIIFIDR